MKKRYFIPLLIIPVLIGQFLVINTVSASFPEQTEINSSFGHNSTQSQMWIQTFGAGLTGNASLINFYGYKTAPVKKLDVFLIESPTSNDSILDTTGFGCNSPPTGGSFVASTTITSADWPDTAGEFTKYFNNPYTLNVSKYYAICLHQTTASQSESGTWILYGADNNVFSAGQLWRNPYDYYPTYPQFGTAPTYWGIYDLYFNFNEPIPVNDIIDLTYPPDSASNISPYFDKWGVDVHYKYFTTATTSDYYYASAFIATSTTPLENNGGLLSGSILTDCDYAYCDPNNYSSFQFEHTLAGMKTNTTYYAQARLYYKAPNEYLATLVATSTIISFNTGQQTLSETFFPAPTSTITTSTPVQITCDPNDPFYQYSMCKMFTYLFVPNPDSLNKFAQLGDEIQNKPPLGYFTQIKNVLSGVNASGTPVFDIGNYSAFSGIFGPLRTGISWLLWLFFGVVIFNRLRYLEL